MTVVAAADLRAALIARLADAGAHGEAAGQQADMLVEAELRGLPSHGALRLRMLLDRIANGVCVPDAIGTHHWRGSAWLDVDGGQGFGPAVAQHALDAAATRVEETGVCLVTIHHSNHLGMLAWYAEHWARRGYVLVAVTTSEALVHPYGGTRALLGTNPIAIGVPTAASDPFVMDLATSLVSMGRIHDHAGHGRPIPAGWARDADGAPTTDATAAKSGAIAPFGDAKGYALGLGIELLVTALTGSAIGTAVRGTVDPDQPSSKGDVFILTRPQHGVADVLTGYLDDVRASEPADPARPVLIPGDRARGERARRAEAGIEIRDDLWTQLSTRTQGSDSDES